MLFPRHDRTTPRILTKMASKTEETSATVTDDVEKAPPVAAHDDDDDEYPPFPKLVLIMTALYLSMFLVALVGLPDMGL
jgi:hypothetical protein